MTLCRHSVSPPITPKAEQVAVAVAMGNIRRSRVEPNTSFLAPADLCGRSATVAEPARPRFADLRRIRKRRQHGGGDADKRCERLHYPAPAKPPSGSVDVAPLSRSLDNRPAWAPLKNASCSGGHRARDPAPVLPPQPAPWAHQVRRSSGRQPRVNVPAPRPSRRAGHHASARRARFRGRTRTNPSARLLPRREVHVPSSSSLSASQNVARIRPCIRLIPRLAKGSLFTRASRRPDDRRRRPDWRRRNGSRWPSRLAASRMHERLAVHVSMSATRQPSATEVERILIPPERNSL